MSTENSNISIDNSSIYVPTVTTVKLRPGKPVNEIADLAADLVYGAVPNGEGTGLENVENLSINSYPKDGSREHDLLHTYYRGYKSRKEQMEFENAPLEVVKTWDRDKQQKWFTAQMNKGARTVLPALAGVVTLPWTISAAVAAPVATALGIGGGMLGSKIGSDYGRKIDARRHGYTNYETIYGLAGGLAGGVIGGGIGSIGDAVIHTKFPGVLAPIKPNKPINYGYERHYRSYPNIQSVLSPKTGSSVYTGLRLPNPKAAQFTDDVALLKYYAQNQIDWPKTFKQGIVDFDSYINPRILGEGAESEVHLGLNNIGQKPFVIKLLKDDLVSSWRYGSETPPILWTDDLGRVPEIRAGLARSAAHRNRHMFMKKVQPIIVKQNGMYRAGFVQDMLKPLKNQFELVHINDLYKRPVMQELYPIRGYNIENKGFGYNFNPYSLGPVDDRIPNFGMDGNGILWGIDLLKSGGEFKKR